ncbi:MAG TPA: hypothetical protein VL418_16710 [Devosiaceae bacterium]|nr:hypothetical protein [Devosiaceae bacterium]
MSGNRSTILKCVLAAAALTAPLGGCTYDYLQNTDRVGYTAGDAVEANLEAETVNPSKRSTYVTSGLGANGLVIPVAASATSSPAAPPQVAATP